MARTGRPPLPPYMRQKHINRCAEALTAFENFCTHQEQRVMKRLLDYSDDTHRFDVEDIKQRHREERLGPYFNGLDRQDERVQMEVRR